jgi:hypothetical protein
VDSIKLTRDKYTAVCTTESFVDGRCVVWPDMAGFDCCEKKIRKNVCCIVCSQLEGCERPCERINPDG